jgi:hypothetical protein
VPLIDVPPVEAAQAAVRLGADALILTGATFADSLDRVRKAKAAGIRRPVYVGGSVTLENAAQTLAVADGAIVSTSLMRDDAAPSDIIRWDSDKTHRFMDAVRAMPLGHGR